MWMASSVDCGFVCGGSPKEWCQGSLKGLTPLSPIPIHTRTHEPAHLLSVYGN